MELKYVCRDLPGGTRTRSNRTFMELKLVSRIYIAFKTICSNRTFMELKSEYPFKQWL